MSSVSDLGSREEENVYGVEKLYFDLASQSRLGILRALETKPLKMQEIGRKLKLTDTETFRQVHRLSEDLLIQKQPDGLYSLTQYGRLVLRLSRSLEFAYEYRNSLLTRDIWGLPEEFIDRFGELSKTHLNPDVLETINKIYYAVSNAEKYIWVIGNSPQDAVGPKIFEKISQGVSFKFMFHESYSKFYKDLPEIEGKIEKRSLASVPGTMVCTDKIAGVTIASLDKRADYVLFYGDDPSFMKWARDLFLYYWTLGKHCYPEVRGSDS